MLSGSGTKRLATPTRPTGKVKQRDFTNVVEATLCKGSVAIIDIKKPSGDIAFKAGLRRGILEKKAGTKDLDVISVVTHKKEPTIDSEKVTVGKNRAPDFVSISYSPDIDGAKKLQSLYATAYERHTMPYKPSAPKPKARPGKIVNASDPIHLDERLFSEDVAVVVASLYPDETVFDDDETAAEILETYFSLISVDEAKELVLEAYANDEN